MDVKRWMCKGGCEEVDVRKWMGGGGCGGVNFKKEGGVKANLRCEKG